jgi:small-conductance mechanosensitive channel
MSLEDLKLWIEPAAVLAMAVGLGYLFRNFFVQRMTLLSQRTKTTIDDLLVDSCRRHIPFWFLLGGLAIATRRAPLQPELIATLDLVFSDALILSLSLVASNLVTGWIESGTAKATGTLASSSLLRNVVRGSIVTVGLLAVVHRHYPITPILGALGIGSLAVALALQPTLSNLFAGLYVTLAKPLRIGDFVELESGAQGYIVDIGWRATKLRQGVNNLVIVPNARLVEMILKNFSLPELEQTVTVTLGVAYDSDLARVEAVTLEVAREAQASSPAAVKGFEPQVLFHTFGPSSIDFNVVLRVAALPDRGALVHEFVKRLKARFEREGIEIPFPQQVVHKAERSQG